MGMNQKTALKILGLGPGASLAQAKKAFRNLAKQYHPDRYPPGLSANDDGAEQAEARMNRMKQINQAFHLLAPLLGSADSLSGKVSTDKPPISKDKKTRSKQDISFMDILRMFKKELKFKFHRKAGFRPRPSVKQPLKSKVRRANRAGKTVRFATVLHSLHPIADFDKKSRDRDSRVHPYANFVKYMDLKKKIDARNRSEQNFNRIEKIKPVTRVNPFGDKK